ncbi:MAG: invasion associated locus B family protein [Marinovum sp.]|nr:invasion associated locus B family protein [Marinovum sp.]
MRLRRLFAVACLGATSFSSVAWSQQSATNGQVFDDWRLVCQAVGVNQTRCVISQSLSISESNAFLAEVTVRLVETDEGSQTVIAVSTPTNMLLPIRPAYRIEDSGETIAMEWRTCTPRVCSASRILSPAELAALKAGIRMTMGYQPTNQETPVNFPVSLKGITAGIAALGG